VTSDTEHRWCTPEELRRITAAAAAAGDPAGALLCRFLVETGLRISEAASVRWGDFFPTPQGNVGLRVVGKGCERPRYNRH